MSSPAPPTPETREMTGVSGVPPKVTPLTVGGFPVGVVAPTPMATTSRRLAPEPGVWEKERLEVLALLEEEFAACAMPAAPPLTSVAVGLTSVASGVAPFACRPRDGRSCAP